MTTKNNPPPMETTLRTEIATVEELLATLTPTHNKVLVQFPYNDYATYGRGGVIKVRTGRPLRRLKPIADKKGTYVLFDRLKWDITGVVALVLGKADGGTFRRLMITGIQAR